LDTPTHGLIGRLAARAIWPNINVVTVKTFVFFTALCRSDFWNVDAYIFNVVTTYGTLVFMPFSDNRVALDVLLILIWIKK
jgi:hypothetical protein